MVAWWWIPLMLMMGVSIGVMLAAVCAANSAEERGKRWWEDE